MMEIGAFVSIDSCTINSTPAAASSQARHSDPKLAATTPLLIPQGAASLKCVQKNLKCVKKRENIGELEFYVRLFIMPGWNVNCGH